MNRRGNRSLRQLIPAALLALAWAANADACTGSALRRRARGLLVKPVLALSLLLLPPAPAADEAELPETPVYRVEINAGSHNIWYGMRNWGTNSYGSVSRVLLSNYDQSELGNLGSKLTISRSAPGYQNRTHFAVEPGKDPASDGTFAAIKVISEDGSESRTLWRRNAVTATSSGSQTYWQWTSSTPFIIPNSKFTLEIYDKSVPCTDWSLGSWSSCAADPANNTRNIQTRTVSALPAGCAPPLPDRPAEQYVCDTCATQGAGRDWNIGCFHQLTDRLSPAPVCNGSWGSWTPATNTQCPDTTITQTSACDNPAELERTRRQAGTKTAGC